MIFIALKDILKFSNRLILFENHKVNVIYEYLIIIISMII